MAASRSSAKNPPQIPPEPWFSFLEDLHVVLEHPVDFHCFGGFIVSQLYGFARETADLDVLTVNPATISRLVGEAAGKGSSLHQKHKVYLDLVHFANHPAEYESRLIRVFPCWTNVRLWALEPHDLALTKLERSDDVDIRDVLYLAETGQIDRTTLISRFESEFEPYVTGRTPTWNRSTLEMWVDACWPDGT